jgi:hypothetical protein
MAAMKVIHHIARAGETHTIEEKLVKHCAFGLFACMIDEGAARKIQLVLISDKTFRRRIKDCAAKVLDELFRRLRLSESFRIRLDGCC